MPTLKSLLASGIPVVHLGISECIVATRPMLVTTVLGSCVAATFHHPGTGMSAIFHAMLPETPEVAARHAIQDAPCRFVDRSIESILERFAARRAPLQELEIKLFGGACSLESCTDAAIASQLNVGERNAVAARRILAEAGLPIAREHVGGARGRKLFFHTPTGHVWVRRLGIIKRGDAADRV